jgi:hypothetical protein
MCSGSGYGSIVSYYEGSDILSVAVRKENRDGGDMFLRNVG